MSNILIFGRRRQGKSTLSLALACSLSDVVVVFDPNHQFRQFPATVYETDVVGDWMDWASEPESPKPVVIVYRPDGDFDTRFTELESLIWEYRRNVPHTLIVDEASLLQKTQAIHPSLDKRIRQAPALIHTIQTTHRPVDTHRLNRALANDLFFFQNDSARDVELVRSEYSEEVAERMKNLKRYECIHYWLDPGGVKRYTVWSDSERWRMDNVYAA